MGENNTEIYKELQPGTELCGGKYIIEKKIGEGGFGITYRATQTGLNRAVCIKEYFIAGGCIRDTYAKTIHLQGLDEDKFERYRKAFVKEAQTLAALHHPGIVEVIDIFDENNTSYMVMPFVEGRSLQSIVEKNGPLSYPEAVNYIAQVANAVGYIHDRHILHRDIKPDNIMITSDYKAVLIDFGSAREFEEDKTQAQTSILSQGYAPTEQYSRTSRKGSYTDIYALGATLYYILTGKVPVNAAARITESLPEPKELNPDLPDEANRTIMKAMQLKPQDRHLSIAEFMDDLRNFNVSTADKKESLKQQVVTDDSVSESQKSNQNPPKNDGSNKSKKNVIIIVAIFIILLLIILCVILIRGKNNNSVVLDTASIDTTTTILEPKGTLQNNQNKEEVIVTEQKNNKSVSKEKNKVIDGAVVFFIQNPNKMTDEEMANPIPNSWIYYEEDEFKVTKEQMKTIDVVARKISNLPEEYICTIVGISTYRGSDAYVQKKSEKRAEEVGKIMIEKYGIPNDRIIIEGKGKTVNYGLF